MDMPADGFERAGTLKELKAEGRLVMHGHHRPVLVLFDGGKPVALDNRCPHMGFPLDRGTVEHEVLTCHWHHARFDIASGCAFDLWADDVPACPVRCAAARSGSSPSSMPATPRPTGGPGSTTASPTTSAW